MADTPFARVSTDTQNELFQLLEKFGSHDQQYYVLLATLIAFAKATKTDLRQLQLDIRANYPRIGAPDVMLEH